MSAKPDTAKSRGVLYIVWGEQGDALLERSKASLAAVHPELPVEVVRLPADGDPVRTLLQKSRMFELSPFEETLYLDADTVVLSKLDFGFEKAARFGVAGCICEAPWARRYASIQGDGIEYNTGVLFFTPKARPLFERWAELAPKLDSSCVHYHQGKIEKMPFNDQCSFAVAVEETKIVPFVLPLNWNFRPQWQRSFFGPIRVWHDYATPPEVLKQLSDYYEQDDAIIQYHPAN